ncbi:MAG: AAA domain-containing protein [Actinomycetes bacterium]
MSAAPDATASVVRALGALADRPRRPTLDVRRDGPLVWAGAELKVHATQVDAMGEPLVEQVLVPSEGRGLKRLIAIDTLHAEEQLLRLGTMWVTGRTLVDGRPTEVHAPLVVRPTRPTFGLRIPMLADVTFERRPLEPGPIATDLPEPLQVALLDVVERLGRSGVRLNRDDALDARLLERMGMVEPVLAAARAAGFDVGGIVTARETPHRTGRDGLVVQLGWALHVARDVQALDLGSTLRRWATLPVAETALARLYGTVPASGPTGDDDGDRAQDRTERVVSPLPLTPAQEAVLRTARRNAVTVVSGAPGTGKSHTAAAAALDAVSRGESVLLATRSGHAADVLADLLDRVPGPTPVQFGGSVSRRDIAEELAAGLPEPAAGGELDGLEARLAAARDRVDAALDAVVAVLEREDLVARAPVLELTAGPLVAAVPGAFSPEADPDALWHRWTRLRDDDRRGPLAALHRRRSARALDRDLRREPGVDDATVVRALEVARARRAATRASAAGGPDVAALFDEVARARAEERDAVGVLLQATTRGPSSRAGRRAVASLATALRAGRARRRQQLAELAYDDLVILDEASQIDQVAAAPALLRARRALVVGDPRQLRHVSFVSDARTRDAVAEAGAERFADRLDVRRASAFDTAAAAAPVLWLDEHVRSVPHLIEFSADRFYAGRLHVATRHPRVEAVDAIDVVRVAGRFEGGARRGDDGVNRAEVEAVLEVVAGLSPDRDGTVGLVTPFRAHADAMEAAVLDALSLERVRELGLKVGTVHEFQGAERDTLVVSLAVADDAPPGSRRFVEDPHLANVMVTRGRRRVVVVTSLTGDPGGLLGAYLDHAERPPAPPAGAVADDRWTVALAAELARGGEPVRPGYPVGPWTVDLCLGAGEDAWAVLTRPHPDGPAAHVARRDTLARAGWHVVEVFPSAYDGEVVPAAVDLVSRRRSHAR